MCVLLAACADEYPVQVTEGDGWRWLGGTQYRGQAPVQRVTSADDLATLWAISERWDSEATPEVDFGAEAVVVIDSLRGYLSGFTVRCSSCRR